MHFLDLGVLYFIIYVNYEFAITLRVIFIKKVRSFIRTHFKVNENCLFVVRGEQLCPVGCSVRIHIIAYTYKSKIR